MINNAYSLFDTKSLLFSPPFYQPVDGAAVRLLADLVNDPNTTVGRHPADFVLYQLGTFDDQKGTLSPLEIKRHVIDAVALVTVSRQLSLEQMPGYLPEQSKTNGQVTK